MKNLEDVQIFMASLQGQTISDEGSHIPTAQTRTATSVCYSAALIRRDNELESCRTLKDAALLHGDLSESLRLTTGCEQTRVKKKKKTNKQTRDPLGVLAEPGLLCAMQNACRAF